MAFPVDAGSPEIDPPSNRAALTRLCFIGATGLRASGLQRSATASASATPPPTGACSHRRGRQRAVSSVGPWCRYVGESMHSLTYLVLVPAPMHHARFQSHPSPAPSRPAQLRLARAPLVPPLDACPALRLGSVCLDSAASRRGRWSLLSRSWSVVLCSRSQPPVVFGWVVRASAAAGRSRTGPLNVGRTTNSRESLRGAVPLSSRCCSSESSPWISELPWTDEAALGADMTTLCKWTRG